MENTIYCLFEITTYDGNRRVWTVTADEIAACIARYARRNDTSQPTTVEEFLAMFREGEDASTGGEPAYKKLNQLLEDMPYMPSDDWHMPDVVVSMDRTPATVKIVTRVVCI